MIGDRWKEHGPCELDSGVVQNNADKIKNTIERIFANYSKHFWNLRKIQAKTQVAQTKNVISHLFCKMK